MDRKRKEIYNVKGMAESARYTEYKNLESAACEIIDNSIEAFADKILIIISETINNSTGRKEINEIGFLDNGIGMDIETLHGCLALGEGTRRSRKGIGRFGVGLLQASFFACPRVEVYSWQSANNAYKVYLDTEKMKSGEQDYIEEPKMESVPQPYSLYMSSFKIETGTLVIWRNVDKSAVKTASSLITRLDKEIGKIYRYFLSNKTVEIKLFDDNNRSNHKQVLARDPLFLLDNVAILGDSKNLGEITKDQNRGESIFEPYIPKGYDDNLVLKDISFLNNAKTELKSQVKIKFSIVKEKFYRLSKSKYNNPGDSPIGQEVKNYTGISIVRAGREVDFGNFGFFDELNSPYHRWWGVEIQFDSLLDEVFKISNNKQHVELKKPLNNEVREAESEGINLLWVQLNEIIRPTITDMVKLNKERQKGNRSSNNEIKQKEQETLKVTESNITEEQKPVQNENREDILTTYLGDILDFGEYDSKETFAQYIEYLSKNTVNQIKLIEDDRFKKELAILFENDKVVLQINKKMCNENNEFGKNSIFDALTNLFICMLDSFNEEVFSPETLVFLKNVLNRFINKMINKE